MIFRWYWYWPVALLLSAPALAHGLAGADAAFVASNKGVQFIPFLYLGAKHMVTGYDHLLFIFGVIFFLYRLTHVALYVTLFSIGHSITLLLGVLGGIQTNAYLIDAVIGLSVAYKAFDNFGGFRTLFGIVPDQKWMILMFGLFHGLGLATKLQTLRPSREGLITNIVAFNVGVELGQLCALSVILSLMVWWRSSSFFQRQAVMANSVILGAGFLLMEFQLIGYSMTVGAIHAT